MKILYLLNCGIIILPMFIILFILLLQCICYFTIFLIVISDTRTRDVDKIFTPENDLPFLIWTLEAKIRLYTPKTYTV